MPIKDDSNDLILEPVTQLKLGELLMHTKIISQAQLVRALAEQKALNAKSKRQFKLGEILLFIKALDVDQLQQALLRQKPRSVREKELRAALKSQDDAEITSEDPWEKPRHKRRNPTL